MPEFAQKWVHHAKRNATLLIILGVLMVIFGVLAIASPLMTGLAVAMFVGALMLVSGVLRIVAAIKSGHWGSGILGTLLGLLGIAAGIILLARPLLGLATLTLLLAAYFLATGICEIMVSFKMKPEKSWGWMLFGGMGHRRAGGHPHPGDRLHDDLRRLRRSRHRGRPRRRRREGLGQGQRDRGQRREEGRRPDRLTGTPCNVDVINDRAGDVSPARARKQHADDRGSRAIGPWPGARSARRAPS
jgi:uncharacterized membrane protein HdeD (DUF308 family)